MLQRTRRWTGPLAYRSIRRRDPQIVNPKIMDQIVIVNNVCGQSIRVQVCYAGRPDCIEVSLNGYQKLQRTLGIAAGSTNFRYEYRELF